MMRIKIKDLAVNTILGVFEWEKQRLRPVIFNITLTFDPSQVIASGKLEDTLNYDAICQDILAVTEGKTFELLETLAHIVMDRIKAYPLLQKIELEIDKPGALPLARSVSVSYCLEL